MEGKDIVFPSVGKEMKEGIMKDKMEGGEVWITRGCGFQGCYSEISVDFSV